MIPPIPRRCFLRAAAGLGVLSFLPAGFAAGPRRVYAAGALVDSIGANVHLSYSDTVYGRFDDIIYPLLLESGIRHVRDGIPTDPKANADMWLFQRGRKLVAQGIRFSCVTTDEDWAYGATDLDRLEQAVEWYGSGVEFLEGSNEPNYSKNPLWPQISAAAQRRLYARVKNSPKLRHIDVLGPSYWGPTGAPAGDLSDAMDYGNIHSYPGGRHPETPREGSLDFYVKGAAINCGGKPLVASETGYHAALQTRREHPPASEPIIVRYLPRLVLWYFMHGIKRTYLYEFADSHDRGPDDQESNFGLVTAGGQRKPRFHAIKNLIALFADTGAAGAAQALDYSIGPDSADLYSVNFQRSNGDYLLAVWLGVSGWDIGTKTELPPTTRDVVLTLPQPMMLAEIHNFNVDGGVAIDRPKRLAPQFPLRVSDSLAVLRLRRPG